MDFNITAALGRLRKKIHTALPLAPATCTKEFTGIHGTPVAQVGVPNLMSMEAPGQLLQKQRSKCFQLPQKVSYNFTVILVTLLDYFGEGAKKLYSILFSHNYIAASN